MWVWGFVDRHVGVGPGRVGKWVGWQACRQAGDLLWQAENLCGCLNFAAEVTMASDRKGSHARAHARTYRTSYTVSESAT